MYQQFIALSITKGPVFGRPLGAPPATAGGAHTAPFPLLKIRPRGRIIKVSMTITEFISLLTPRFNGDISNDPSSLTTASKDTSLFERMPLLVVFPKDASDVRTLVQTVNEANASGGAFTLTARSAGTDMSGGPLTYSIVVDFTRYMNACSLHGTLATTEPGVYYRDFEKMTLKKNLLLPSYPASRNIAALGGIVNNNSGGERSLEFGKTERYVEEVEVILSDGSLVLFKELDRNALEEKKKLTTLEGTMYREMDTLLTQHKDLILAKKPKVSKNSAGYALWSARNYEKDTTNLAKLICGAQGTLALMATATLSLVHPPSHRSMLVVFAKEFTTLPDIVERVLAHNPESFESYDQHTMGLAVRFLPQMLMQLGLKKALFLGFSFIPEVLKVITGGTPKLVLMAEFARNNQQDALTAAKEARESLRDLHLPTEIMNSSKQAEKYWIVRRESFALLRKNLKGLYASPFIDDFVVPPASYPEFIPKLEKLLNEYKLLYTITGHIGNGNFHIIPLMDISDPHTHTTILELSKKVYDLVLSYGGTTTGEHNDGIIRTPFLTQEFGSEMVEVFGKVKKIFDPHTIFNPGKKVGGTFDDIAKSLRKH